MADISHGDRGQNLAKGLARTGERIARLVEEAVAQGHLPEDRAQAILGEFQTGMEELRVAEEELIVQAEQLGASQQAIDAERERFAGLFEFAPDGYVETDDTGKILEANSAASQLLGVPIRYLGGKLIHSFVAPDDRRRLRQALVALSRGEGVQQAVVQLAPRNSPQLWAELRIGGHYDPVDEMFRVRWLIRDVSERMKLERELTQLHVSVDLLSALAEVNRLVEGEDDALASILARLVELARRVASAEGDADADVMLVGDDGELTVRAFAGSPARQISNENSLQGPAAQTQRDGVARTLRAKELDGLLELTSAVGDGDGKVTGLACHPIRIGGAVVGVFNLYLYGPSDLDDAAQLAKLLAENAAASISNAQVYASARKLAAGLATALESRGVIEQAKGILMAMQGLSADEAFDILRRASQRQNRKLRAIAEEMVAKATSRRRPPGPPPG